MTGRWRSRGVICLSLLEPLVSWCVILKPTRRLFVARPGGEDSRVPASVGFRTAASCLRVFRFAAAMVLELLDISHYVKINHGILKWVTSARGV